MNVKLVNHIIEDKNFLLNKKLESGKLDYHDKLHMLYLFKISEVKTKIQAARILGRHRQTVGKWLNIYHKQGLAGLLAFERKKGGRPSIIQIDIQEKLKEKLNSSQGFKSYKDIQFWLETNHGIVIKQAKSLFYLINKKLTAKPKVIRPRNIGQNQELAENFKKNLAY